MSKFSVDLFLENLPESITRDEHLSRLAELAARCMKKSMDETGAAAIYCRIDDLPENVLDILAVDLKVDWYNYEGTLQEKRRTIKDSWYVHRKMGSVAAVERALCDIWPQSIVEEWFDYGGDPYHFRIILEALANDEPIYPERAVERVRMFKPARSAMDSEQAIIKVTFGIVIDTANPNGTNQKYHVDVAGTLPGRKNVWRDTQSEIIESVKPDSVFYHVPTANEIGCGSYPDQATHGTITDDGISLGASTIEAAYSPRLCGTSLNSLM